jgi:hypothetical protein
MTIGPDNHSIGSTTGQDRFGGGVSPARSLESRSLEPISALDRAASLPSLDLQGLSEPVFHPNGWMEAGALAESMADHPLLRGLLLELPARGTMPATDWLDRWFEAARSILELLYVQEARRG